MTTRTYCDRCGAELLHDQKWLLTVRFDGAIGGADPNNLYMDLCESCKNDVKATATYRP